MEYAVLGFFAFTNLVLMWVVHSHTNDIDELRNKIRYMENSQARQSREVHVHHHGVSKGQGKAALIDPQVNALAERMTKLAKDMY